MFRNKYIIIFKKENNIIHIKDYYNITKKEITTYFILMELDQMEL